MCLGAAVLYVGRNNEHNKYIREYRVKIMKYRKRFVYIVLCKTVDSTLKLSEQCMVTVRNANRTFGLIMRTIKSRSLEIILRLLNLSSNTVCSIRDLI